MTIEPTISHRSSADDDSRRNRHAGRSRRSPRAPVDTPTASPPPSATATPPSSSRWRCSAALLVLLAASILLGLSSSTCWSAAAGSAWAAPTRASTRRWPTTAPARSPRSPKSARSCGTTVLAILVVLIAIVCVVTRRWRLAAFAVFALLVESATYYVTSLRGSPRAPVRPPAGRPGGRHQLSLGPHRRRGRRLRRPGAAADEPFHQQPVEGAGLDRRDPADHLRRALAHVPRACTIRSTSPVACSSASGRSWWRCSPAARPARPRRGGGEHEGGGRRPRGQDARRRALGAAAHARGGGRLRSRSGSRCRRASGRRPRSSGRWRKAPS